MRRHMSKSYTHSQRICLFFHEKYTIFHTWDMLGGENDIVKVQFWTSPWAWVMLCHHPSLSHSVLQVHQWMTYTQSCLSHCNFISATLAALDYPFPEQYNTFYHLQIVSAWRQSMLFDLWTSDCSPLQSSLQSALDPARGEGHVMFVVLNCRTI